MTFDRDIRIGRRVAFGVLALVLVQAVYSLYAHRWTDAAADAIWCVCWVSWVRMMARMQRTRDMCRDLADATMKSMRAHTKGLDEMLRELDAMQRRPEGEPHQ